MIDSDSDIDYYDASRLPSEPVDGVNDIHLQPTLPRTARVMASLGAEADRGRETPEPEGRVRNTWVPRVPR